MDELIERVARAIYEADPMYEGGEYVDWHQVTPGGYLLWEQMIEMEGSCIHVDGHLRAVRKQARAAIAAMRAAEFIAACIEPG